MAFPIVKLNTKIRKVDKRTDSLETRIATLEALVEYQQTQIDYNTCVMGWYNSCFAAIWAQCSCWSSFPPFPC
jgi:hypothetical protein